MQDFNGGPQKRAEEMLVETLMCLALSSLAEGEAGGRLAVLRIGIGIGTGNGAELDKVMMCPEKHLHI